MEWHKKGVCEPRIGPEEDGFGFGETQKWTILVNFLLSHTKDHNQPSTFDIEHYHTHKRPELGVIGGKRCPHVGVPMGWRTTMCGVPNQRQHKDQPQLDPRKVAN